MSDRPLIYSRRVEGQIKEIEGKQEKKKAEVGLLRTPFIQTLIPYQCSSSNSKQPTNSFSNSRRPLLHLHSDFRVSRMRFPRMFAQVPHGASRCYECWRASRTLSPLAEDAAFARSIRARARSCSVSGLFTIFSSLNLFSLETGGQFRMSTTSSLRSSMRISQPLQWINNTRHARFPSSWTKNFLLRSILCADRQKRVNPKAVNSRVPCPSTCGLSTERL